MIIFHEKDGNIIYQSDGADDINLMSVLASISRYKYFYNKVITIGGYTVEFSKFTLEQYEKHKDEIEVQEVEVYTHIPIRLRFNEEQKQKVQEKKRDESASGEQLLNFFQYQFLEEHHIPYVITNKFIYIKKFRQVMDIFYESGFNDKSIRNFIKRAVQFGNHKGEIIYVDWLFDQGVLQNYLLVAKGLKDITAVWRHLDVSLSNFERKKIKYLMNLKNFDSLTDVEKDICMKFYKRHNENIFNDLYERRKTYNKVNAKLEILQLLAKEYDTPEHEMLRKMKHEKKYLDYEYTLKQVKESLTDEVQR